MKNKKTIITNIITAIGLFALVIGSTYAYFAAQTGEGKSTDIKISANTVDTFTFETGSAININIDQENFADGKGNQSNITYAKAMLTANNKTNSATEHYNLYLNISDNNFSYTANSTYPEIILTIKDASNNEITSISGLEYKTVTDGKGVSISGFDITTKAGLITLLSNKEITTTSTKIDEWNITTTFINYKTDQSKNAGKSFSGQILISKDSFNDYTPNTINTLNATKNGNDLTVNLDVEKGSNEIDKYYYAIEEKNNIAMIDNKNNIQRLNNRLATNTLTYIESNSSSYTFTNLSASKDYKVLAYAIDKNKIKSNTYEFNYYSDAYIYPIINKVETSTTSSSITATITATKGTNNISKYYYSIDGGNSFVESDSNLYTFSGLQIGTYKIIVKIMDSNGKYSNIYVKSAITSDKIMFTFEGTKYQAKSGMTLSEWIKSDYNTWGYDVTSSTLLSKIINNGDNINIYPTDWPLTTYTNGTIVKPFVESNFKDLTNYQNITDEALIKIKSIYKSNLSKFSDYKDITNTTIKNNRKLVAEYLEEKVVLYMPYIFKVTDSSKIKANSNEKYSFELSAREITDDLSGIMLLFIPLAKDGKDGYYFSVIIYTAIFLGYAICRIRKWYFLKKKPEHRREFTSICFGVFLAVMVIICAVSSPNDTIADGNSNTEIAENTTIESEPISKEDSQSFDDTALTDGVYEGKAYGYDGAVKATVTIKDGKITDISCSSAESDLWYFDKCKDKVVSEILEAQNTDVDAVSGATYSSNGIKKAVLDALKQAEFPTN